MDPAPADTRPTGLPPLHFRGRGAATVHVWVRQAEAAVELHAAASHDTALRLRSPHGVVTEATPGAPIALPDPGVWDLALTAPTGADTPGEWTVSATGEAYPFVLPGPGIVPSHFPDPEPALLFAAGHPIRVWVDVPDDLPSLTLGAWMPHDSQLTVGVPCGGAQRLDWSSDRRPAYRIVEVPVSHCPGWWEIHADSQSRPFRLTVWEGLPLFLRRPPASFPYARVRCRAADIRGRPLDTRVRYRRQGRLLASHDALAGDAAMVYGLPGDGIVSAAHGLEFEAADTALHLAPGETRELRFCLRRVLDPGPGWVCGDHHTHSYYEDGGQSPDTLVRAARANGLNYVFLTDVPEPLLAAGLRQHDVPGRFLALPGEEVATPEVHMNMLNTRRAVAPPGRGIADWLDAVEAQSTAAQPTVPMLNHPSHVTEYARRLAYFRSWWVADRHARVALVENFDFESWFARLSQGRRLPGLWTTDSHDMTYLPPGRKRTYVYVGAEFTEQNLIAALRQGRSFSTREPGALLTIEVNGRTMGETAMPDTAGQLAVVVDCAAARPLTRVELIGDGQVVAAWPGEGRHRLHVEHPCRPEMRWLLARAYVDEEPWPPDGHSIEPLLASGCVAFTNPVWLGARSPS